MRALIVIALLAHTAAADSVCDHTLAIADANAALMSAPELFATAGSIPRSDFDEVLEPRIIAGVEYSLTRILAGGATRGRADAECRARAAQARIDSGPLARALDARAASLAVAIADGERALARLEIEAQQQLATRPELLALRLDLDDLRAALATSRRDRSALPTAALAGAVADEGRALADLEQRDARLRTLDAIDVSVRAGIDRGLYVTDTPAYLATVSITINTGLLFQRGANARADAARTRIAHERAATIEAQSATDAERITQLATLIGDLERERALAAKLTGIEARRFERMIWHELATRSAEHAFLVARAEATRELVRR